MMVSKNSCYTLKTIYLNNVTQLKYKTIYLNNVTQLKCKNTLFCRPFQKAEENSERWTVDTMALKIE